MVFCFVSAGVLIVARLSAGFRGTENGWKSFTVAGGLLAIGAVAGTVLCANLTYYKLRSYIAHNVQYV